jgi:hypothetical protein
MKNQPTEVWVKLPKKKKVCRGILGEKSLCGKKIKEETTVVEEKVIRKDVCKKCLDRLNARKRGE